MGSDPISVLLVDDNLLSLKLMSKYFPREKGFELVGQATDGFIALQIIKSRRVNVVLSDINMPMMTGLELLGEINKLKNPPVFIGITSIDQDDDLIQAVVRGGSGYLLKSQSPSSIRQAVRDAFDGGMVVSPNAMRSLIEKVPRPHSAESQARNLLEEVTAKDYPLRCGDKSILKLLCLGKSNAAIATELRYSASAIKKRVSILMKEFGASSRLDLVVLMLNKP